MTPRKNLSSRQWKEKWVDAPPLGGRRVPQGNGRDARRKEIRDEERIADLLNIKSCGFYGLVWSTLRPSQSLPLEIGIFIYPCGAILS